jgi:hypothetical protein
MDSAFASEFEIILIARCDFFRWKNVDSITIVDPADGSKFCAPGPKNSDMPSINSEALSGI